MSSSQSLFYIKQDSFIKKRMFSVRHELGGVTPDQEPAEY